MAYLNPFIRLTFGGDLADEEEIWSCNLHLRQTGAIADFDDVFDAVAGKLEDIEDRLALFIGATETLVPANVQMKWVKVAPIGTDGKYLKDAVEVPSTAFGSFNGGYIPQASIVNGLVSAKWKDPGKNNRFYMPAYLPSGDRNWALNTLQQTSYAGKLRDLVEGINTDLEDVLPGTNVRVAVLSNSGPGYEMDVEEVRIGRLIDTQRRRRNQLSENYVSVSVS